ncbi:MAG: exosome protein [Thermoprotei archaeon]|nr:MAG: exosome protein [Thermoprotei archaeon]
MPVKVKSLELIANCHATEDVSKVKQAMLNLIPEKLRSKVEFTQSVLRGHYGNPITRIVLYMKNKDAEETLKHIASKMSNIDKRILKTSLDLRTEASKLYLRFSKQEAYLGNMVLEDSDDIVRAIVTFKGVRGKSKSIEEYLENIGMI